ncbi:MAG: hypothetical protein U5L75_03500 [Candidatus Campbellbacteria bacterium]|nr:hypothetical protein [Candidatus Campbellbacteria bacterium]
MKITCDVEVSGNDVWLEGPVWVEGNIEFTGNSAINIDPSLGEKSVAIIADKQSDRESSSRIQISNNLEFNGSGEDSSYILLISQNNSAENGGGTDAIKLQNNAEGDLLLYAGHGSITIDNNTDLTEVTAYRIHIQNNATVRYESGLADLVFSTGPSGGYSLKSLEEIQ